MIRFSSVPVVSQVSHNRRKELKCSTMLAVGFNLRRQGLSVKSSPNVVTCRPVRKEVVDA